MAQVSSQPTYLYKILSEAVPEPLPITLPTTPLDEQDGFIHLSTAARTAKTAVLFFNDYRRLWILQLRVADLDGETRFLDGDLWGCAHVHGSTIGLGKGNVAQVHMVERGEKESWEEVAGVRALRDH